MPWTHCLRIAAAALLLARAGAADATLVYSDTVLVRGPEYAAVVELPLQTGAYRITAYDLKWFDAPLQALSFGVFTATAAIETMVGAGALEFYQAAPGKVFLQIYARPAAGQSAGLVSLQAESVAVVALPASLWLLLSALGAGGVWRWREQRVPVAAAKLAVAT